MAEMRERVALVTGGSRGIGRAIAERLAARGVRLAIANRDPGPAVDELRREGIEALAVPTDLAVDDPAAAVERTVTHYGRIDILIHSAGTNIRKPALEFTLEEWRRIQRLNVEAAFVAAQAAARHMLPRRWGRVVFVASIMSFHGGLPAVPITAYTTSKAALLGLTRGLAKEWAAAGVTVNALCPGYTRTEFTAAVQKNPALDEAITRRIPAGRWAEPDDVGEAGAFLCSDQAGYITGQSLVIDGGFLVN
ncbi:MAG TPA: SDR family oxidoreductase [Thermodesulfobacteriota bacterium]